ncbi:Neurexin-3-beta [Cichlidogyrus casuarinus]|uniref:Neurexin-3-beta n=1 Tax=Cichlidogyrus casuarinus TaxID=1844966 RepID=A0ABD2PI74_9PLAT
MEPREIPGVRVPLLPPNGQVIIGGADRDNVVPNLSGDAFRGSIYGADVFISNGRRNVSLDLLELATNPDWRANVHVGPGVNINVEMPNKSSVIQPTSGYTHENPRIRSYPQSISFDGSSNAVLRDRTWDFITEPSLEIAFHTFEPNGVLFFVYV